MNDDHPQWDDNCPQMTKTTHPQTMITRRHHPPSTTTIPHPQMATAHTTDEWPRGRHAINGERGPTTTEQQPTSTTTGFTNDNLAPTNDDRAPPANATWNECPPR